MGILFSKKIYCSNPDCNDESHYEYKKFSNFKTCDKCGTKNCRIVSVMESIPGIYCFRCNYCNNQFERMGDYSDELHRIKKCIMPKIRAGKME